MSGAESARIPLILKLSKLYWTL